MKLGSFVFGLILGFCALGQQASPVLLGSWTATASNSKKQLDDESGRDNEAGVQQ